MGAGAEWRAHAPRLAGGPPFAPSRASGRCAFRHASVAPVPKAPCAQRRPCCAPARADASLACAPKRRARRPRRRPSAHARSRAPRDEGAREGVFVRVPDCLPCLPCVHATASRLAATGQPPLHWVGFVRAGFLGFSPPRTRVGGFPSFDSAHAVLAPPPPPTRPRWRVPRPAQPLGKECLA